MSRLLIINADDFGLSAGVNYGIIDAHRNGIVTSTTAMMNADAIEHAASLSAETPSLAVGLHFVLSYGKPLTPMPSLQREGKLGKWIWDVAAQGGLAVEEVEEELEHQYRKFMALFGRKPVHIDSHHHVHFIPQVWSVVSKFAQQKGLPLRFDRTVACENGIKPAGIQSSEGFVSHFYAENVSEAFFLHALDESTSRHEQSVEIMCHPGFVDLTLQQSAYCFPRLEELNVLTSERLRTSVVQRGYRLGTFGDL